MERTSETKPVTIVAIGAGNRTNKYLEYAIRNPDRLKLVGVAELNDIRRHAIASKFGLKPEECFADYERFFENPVPADAILIGTPENMHFEPCMKAIEAGYNVLLEKPIAQSLPECAYGFIANLMKENIGPEGLKYFSFIFSVFLFVAFGNILGLFPYAFTFTSHATAVGTLSIAALLFNVAVGIRKRKWGYLRTFMPKGIPLALAPLIVPIETISMLSKPFSLTVRLVANMTVGHIMLKIIAGFIVSLGVFGAVPMLFSACVIVFELFIGVLQAFIYTVLSCIYLGDALRSH